MKRKVLSLFLVVVMAVSLFSACGGKNGNTNNNQEDANNSEKTEVGLQTCEFPACVEGQKGTITYNGDFVEVSNSDKINGADFDVKVKDENKTYTIGVTLSVESNGADEEIKNNKDWMETKAKSFKISEIKETTINKIPVQYYSCVYSTDGEHENKFFNCFIKFPTIEEYYNYTVLLRIDGNKEDALILSALENLLVDIELIGAKPVGAENEIAEIKNDTFDASIYRGQEIFALSNGKTVNVYYNPDIVTSCQNDSDIWLYINDNNDNPYAFSFSEAATAEDYINGFIQSNDHLEFVIAEHKETKIAGRTVHTFLLNGKDNLSEEYGAIELASGVLLTFKDAHVKRGGETGFENVIEALKFVVE